MHILSDEVMTFFKTHHFAIVTTQDGNGAFHNSCKGIVEMTSEGYIYLLDLYHGATYANLKRNAQMSITMVDEHQFEGYCIKGTAIITEMTKSLLAQWEKILSGRVAKRVLKNILGNKGHASHPEMQLPKPKYMIKMKAEEIVNLTPRHVM